MLKMGLKSRHVHAIYKHYAVSSNSAVVAETINMSFQWHHGSINVCMYIVGGSHFFNCLALQYSIGRDWPKEVIKFFEPFLYCKKSCSVYSKFESFGAGSHVVGRLTEFVWDWTDYFSI